MLSNKQISGHPYASNEDEFQSKVKKLWFGRFSRGKTARNSHIRSTSAFEHTFIGEVDDFKVRHFRSLFS